jgi:hypothetical protein
MLCLVCAPRCFQLPVFKCECEELTSVCTPDGELIVIELFYCCMSIRCRGDFLFTEQLFKMIEGYTDTHTDGRDLRGMPLSWAQVP